MATLDQFMKKTNAKEFSENSLFSGATPVKHSNLIRLALLSFLEGGFGNFPKPYALFEDIYSTIIRITKEPDLFGSRNILRISRVALLKQLDIMVRKGEIIKYGKGYRLKNNRTDSVSLEVDPSKS